MGPKFVLDNGKTSYEYDSFASMGFDQTSQCSDSYQSSESSQSDQDQANERYEYSNVEKYVYTLAILIEYATNALVVGLVAPAMVDLKYILKTDISHISYVYSFFSLGFTLGSLISIAYKYVDKYNIFILLSTIRALCMVGLPFSPSLWVLYSLSFLLKLCISGFECGTYVMIIDMWNNCYSPVMHSVKLLYSLGLLLGPSLVAQFLSGDVTKSRADAHELSAEQRDSINYSIDRRSKLMIPFLIGGALTATIPIILIAMSCAKKCKNANNPSQEKRVLLHADNSIDSGTIKSQWCRFVMIGCVTLSTMITNGLIECHIIYSPTYYQYLSIGISAATAAHIVSLMSTFHAFGRFVSIFEAMILSSETMIVLHLSISMTALTLLYFGEESLALIYIGNVMLGFGNSSLYTSFFTFTEKHLRLTESLTSIIFFFSEFLLFFFPFLLGPIIEGMPDIVLYTEFTLVTINMALFLFIMYLNKNIFH